MESLRHWLGLEQRSPYLRVVMERANMEVMRSVAVLMVAVGALGLATTCFSLAFWRPVAAMIWAHRLLFVCLVVFGVIFRAIAREYLAQERPQPGGASHALSVAVAILLVLGVWITLLDYPVMHRYYYLVSMLIVVFGLFYLTPAQSLVCMGATYAATLVGLGVEHFLDSVQAVTLLTYCVLLEAVSVTNYRARLRAGLSQEAARKNSRHDELTLAHNRRSLDEDVPALLGQEVYLLLSDIDKFKTYNDLYGHEMGDAILRAYAQVLFAAFDTGRVYRYGGDEFVCTLTAEEAGDIDERVTAWREGFAACTVAGADVIPTCSGGLVHGTPTTEAEFYDMMRIADLALYEAKDAGRNTLRSYEYSPELAARASEELGRRHFASGAGE